MELVYLGGFFVLMSVIPFLLLGGILKGILAAFSLSILKPLGALMGEHAAPGMVLGLLILGSLFLAPVLLMAGLATLLIAQALFRSHQLAFGEGMLANVLARVHVDKVPAGEPVRGRYHHQLALYHLLRHSRVYSEQAVTQAIATWIEKDGKA